MSDRSPMQLFVYAVHEDEEAAVLRAISDEALGLEWGDTEEPEPARLVLGACYGIHETPLGSSDDLATALQEQAPTAVFKLWQDPHWSGADGHLVAHVPGVGTYETGCTAEGAPHTDVADLIKQLSAVPAGTTVQDWLAGAGDQVLGVTVLAALEPYEKSRR
ncbi:hypothetical protein OG393_32855 (plasmid) [Streptomyces sp. NBC_01216]|uniref:hypothetical protein n=1 Tax=Streptomyces sp. NBC_01216 TaxID=2903778 RepID=UPI002E12E4A5|nr:hypothetical protein OG393_32855 [Streptomyces sp. NBC_01216]